MSLVCRFVDAIEEVPTVRFDLHDGASTTVTNRDTVIGQPDLNQAYNASLLVDGGIVGASSYGLRTLQLNVQITSSSTDDGYSFVAGLLRELDRASNLLMWQPDGVTHPVFFETIRCQPDEIDISNSSVGIWEVRVPVKAKPFALGLRETLGPFTVNNDPAAGSNGHYFDVTGVLGDAPAPCVIVNSGTHNGEGRLSVRQHGTPSDMNGWFFTQCESMTLATDTTNPGGGPDGTMSGTGANNYVRTSFTTTATLVDRLTLTGTVTDAQGLALSGDYRLLVVLRRSDPTSVVRVRANVSSGGDVAVSGRTVTVPGDIARQVVDLGVFRIGAPISRVGYNSVDLPTVNYSVALQAARDSGTGTLDWDYLLLMPADESMMAIGRGALTASAPLVIDGINERVYQTEAGVDPLASTSSFATFGFTISGGIPNLEPNRVNRFFWVSTSLIGSAHNLAKGDVGTMTLHYWPRYLHVRPGGA